MNPRTPRYIGPGGNGRTAFVLSGGGSLGAAQVGMLQALTKAGIQPDLLIGTSIGAVNAAFLAGRPNHEGACSSARSGTGCDASTSFRLARGRAPAAYWAGATT